jgi:hypothetical protein
MELGEEGMGMGKRGMVGKWELDGCSDTLPHVQEARIGRSVRSQCPERRIHELVWERLGVD